MEPYQNINSSLDQNGYHISYLNHDFDFRQHRLTITVNCRPYHEIPEKM